MRARGAAQRGLWPVAVMFGSMIFLCRFPHFLCLVLLTTSK
jgi:hypothetical protein